MHNLADRLLVNGRIYTMDAGNPLVSALAIAGERVLAVEDPSTSSGQVPSTGSGQVPSTSGSTGSPRCSGERLRGMLAPGGKVLDLGGRCVLPGLADSHVHFASYALSVRALDLSAAATLRQMLALVAERAREASPGGWVVGLRWDQERWPERRFPKASDLDRVAPDQPVMLRAKSGHALVANSVALRLAGITAETPDPPGGRIGRGAGGYPTGMLFEDSAMGLVTDLIPPPGPAEMDEALREAFPRAWRVGLTAIHEMDGLRALAAYKRLHARGELGVRVVKYLPPEVLDGVSEHDWQVERGNDWLQVAGIKVFADGALGSRTAAMLAPYAGEPGNVGVLTTDADTLQATARKAAACGLPLAVHAIGDRANRLVLDVLADVGSTQASEQRHRIEHVQLLDPDDVDRLAALGVTASMQPIHATQDCEMADRYWGDRCATSYAWRSLLDARTVLAFGSDAPVEDLSPFAGIQAAVARRRADGYPGLAGWYPRQRLTVEEAVRAYTWGAAYAAGLEDRLGSLAPGKLADLVVLDRDIFACDPLAIAETQVLSTMIGGRIVYGTV